MSEGFGAIVTLIADVVEKVLEATVTFISYVCFLVSIIPPWRFYEEMNNHKGFGHTKDSRVSSLFLTILDAIAIPFLLMSLLSPLRWNTCYHLFAIHCTSHREIFKCRRYFIRGFFYTCREIIALPFLIFALFSPFRCKAVVVKTNVAFTRTNEYGNTHYTYYIRFRKVKDSLEMSVRLTDIWFQTGYDALLDWFIAVPGYLFMWLCPSLWRSFSSMTAYVFLRGPPVAVQDDVWDERMNKWRITCFMQIPFALMDLFALLCAIFGLLSPLRHMVVRDLLISYLCPPRDPGEAMEGSEGQGTSANGFTELATDEATDLAVAIAAADGVNDVSMVPSVEEQKRTIEKLRYQAMDHFYDFEFRYDCIYYGFAAVTDILMIPVLLPLFVTWYRLSPIWNFLTGRVAEPVRSDIVGDSGSVQHTQPFADGDETALASTAGGETALASTAGGETALASTAGGETAFASIGKGLWGVAEYSCVLKQFCLLLCDMVMGPCVLLVFASRLRWHPLEIQIETAVKRKRILGSAKESFKFYQATLISSFLLVLDFLVFPLVLILLLLQYQKQPFVQAWRNNRSWNSDKLYSTGSNNHKLYFHGAVLYAAFVTLGDIIFFLPMCLMLVVSVYKLSFFRELYDHHVATTTTTAGTTTAGTTAGTTTGDVELAPVLGQGSNNNVTTMAIATQAQAQAPSFPYRSAIAHEFLSMLFDIPAFIALAVILCTIWRASIVLAHISTTKQEYEKERLGRSFDTLKHIRRSYFSRRRECILSEFIFLIRDILVLAVPFSLIVGTLYRLPGLIVKLYLRLPFNQRHPSKDAVPLCRVSAANVEYPEIGGPKLLLRLERTIVKDSTTSPPSLKSIDVKKPLELYLLSTSQFWDAVSRVFGDTAATVAKSMIPIVLMDGKDVNLEECTVQLQYANTEDDVAETGGGGADLWVKIDFGTTKRSTVVKKLKALNCANTVLNLQFDVNATDVGSVVLCRLTPTVSELIAMIELGTKSSFPMESLDDAGVRFAVLTADIDNEGGGGGSGFVDSFWIVTCMVFYEVLSDIYHCILFSLVLCSPHRAMQMIVALLEPSNRWPWRVATKCVGMLRHADNYMLEYLSETAKLFNERSKTTNARYNMSRSSHGTHHLDKEYMNPYSKIMKTLTKTLAVTNGCGDVSALVTARKQLHFMMIEHIRLQNDLFHRGKILLTQDTTTRTRKTKAPKYEKENGRMDFLTGVRDEPSPTAAASGGRRRTGNELHVLVSMVSDSRNQLAREIIANMGSIQGAVDALQKGFEEMDEAVKSKKMSKRIKYNVGFAVRPLEDSRLIIRKLFIQAVLDLLFILLFVLLLTSGFRTLPFLRDLWGKSSFSVTRFTTRQIIIIHVKGLGSDILLFFRFIFLSLSVCLFVVGVPHYIEKLFRHGRSLTAACDIAERNVKHTLWYWCELLSLFTAWRTYRISMVAALYAILVPAACLAEGVPLPTSFATTTKFNIGLVLWAALLTGIAMCSSLVTSSESSYAGLNELVVGVVLGGIVLFSFISFCFRNAYWSPTAVDSSISFNTSLNWSHLLALATPAMETLQLSGVIVYFFWNSVGTDGQLSSNGYMTSLSVWNNGVDEYNASMVCACVVVAFWAFIISLPLAVGGNNGPARRAEKMKEITDSTSYDFVMIVISRVFFVWIVATLLRPLSCFTATVNGVEERFVSTSVDVQCENRYWSLPLLAYFIITVCIFHCDSIDSFLSSSHSLKTVFNVRFSPLYSMGLRIAQYAVLILCFCGFHSDSHSAVLGVMIVVIGLITVWSLFSCVSFFIPTSTDYSMCSVAAVGPLRTAGLCCVLWTVLVCLSRQSGVDQSWVSSWGLYIGWIVCAFIGYLGAVLTQSVQYLRWITQIEEQHIEATVSSLLSVAGQIYTYDTPPPGGNNSSFGKAREVLKNNIIDQIKNSHSAAKIAMIVLSLEDSVLAERMSDDFLQGVTKWRTELQSVVTSRDSNIVRSDAEVFSVIRSSVVSLQRGLMGRPPEVTLSKEVLALIFRDMRIPMEIAWEIFEYCMDVSHLRAALASALQRRRRKIQSSTSFSVKADLRNYAVMEEVITDVKKSLC